VLVRDDYTRAKPDPEPYLTALARFGTPNEQALVVEDSSGKAKRAHRPVPPG
jgi:HAD superfamily hydrolase (TIGR01509 family)